MQLRSNRSVTVSLANFITIFHRRALTKMKTIKQFKKMSKLKKVSLPLITALKLLNQVQLLKNLKVEIVVLKAKMEMMKNINQQLQ